MSIHHIDKDCVPAKSLKMSVIELGKNNNKERKVKLPRSPHWY
jgi:hypothetical protein